jgi:uncharacterized protein (TIGR03437 family)
MMLTSQKLSLALVLAAATLAAQNPLLNQVVNAASGTPPGLPNSAIAQGSLFLIWGVGLGPGSIQIAAPPLPATLAGTSITVTVNGTTLTAPMYYTEYGQAVAVMPSSTPVGTGNLSLTYNGHTGSIPVTVVPASFGISNAVDDSDSGSGGYGLQYRAVVTFPNYQYVSLTNTAKPGDTLTIWGTGLGPTPNNGGDTASGPAANIGSAPLVFVGGIPSPSVTYWGRSPNSLPGLDQINFVVPSNAPLGCGVSIVVQTASPVMVSNAPTVSLAATDGATCSDPTQIVPPNVNKSASKVMFISLYQDITTDPNGTTITSHAARVFVEQLPQVLAVTTALGVRPSLGNCYTGYSGSGGVDFLPGTLLDAGTSITLTPPSGNAFVIAYLGSGFGYYATNFSSSSTALPSGTWTFSNGAGGSGVGPLNFPFQVPQQVTWTNQATVSSSPIDRASPLTITWSGGDSNGYVHIVGLAGSVDFECSAPALAGQFTIPSSILLSMPAGASAYAQLSVSTEALPFSVGIVPGLDAVEDLSRFMTAVPVVFR